MGFNYLQTDDRDDYFEQLGKSRRNKVYSLIDENEEVIFNRVRKSALRSFAKKKFNLPSGGKYIWREILQNNGYKVVVEYI